MTEENGDDLWRPPTNPTDSPLAAPAPVPPAPAPPPVSSLAPPPAVPAAATYVTGPIEATPPSRPRWWGRVLAIGTAALLIGGGGYLAINAGAVDGGADSPRAAVEGLLASLSAEDLIGAAEFVEPSERETLVDAGFEVVDELVRLGVFSDDLDLGAVEGIDVEFLDLEVNISEVRVDMAHVFVEGGRVQTSVDGSAVAWGPLITDRVDSEDLSIRESNSTDIEPTSNPIVAVQRNGRWYLSLWYSVAENARLELGEPLPDPADRPAAIGADTPERAVENFVGAAVEVDLATLIGMLDPEEAAALYDYAPLFLEEGQREVDRMLSEARGDGWVWEVTDLAVRSEAGDDVTTVFVDRFAAELSGPEGSGEFVYAEERSRLAFSGDGITFEMVVDGDCATTSIDEGYGTEVTEFCASEMAESVGLESLTTGAFAQFQSLSAPGIVVREADGRWFISPLRTGSAATLDMLRAIDPEPLAETVDAFIEFFRDPFALSSPLFGGAAFGSDPFAPDGFAQDPFADRGDLEPENLSLLSSSLDYAVAYDLTGLSRDDAWLTWFPEAEPLPFAEGVIAEAPLDDEWLGIVVLTGIPFDSDEALADWVGGEVVVDGDFTYVTSSTNWAGPFVIARSGDGITLVGSWSGPSDRLAEVLQVQLSG